MSHYNIIASTDESTVVAEYNASPHSAAEYQSEAALEREFISMLCGQGYEYLAIKSEAALIHNLRNPKEKKPLLTEEEVELLTSPLDLAAYKDAITSAMFKGTARNIVSEDDPKNVEAG